MKDNSKRAKIAMVLLAIVTLLDTLNFVSSYLQISLLEEVQNGFDYTDEELEMNDLREAIIGMVYFIFYLISTVTFIMWFRRAYYNLHQFRDNLKYTEGWAAGAWFVPILNLFRPYQIMNELYSRTNAILRDNFEKHESISEQLVSVWWILWVIGSFISNHEGRVIWRAETIDELIYSSQISMLSSVVWLPAGLLAIKVVHDYSKMETWLYKLRESKQSELDLTKNDDILDAFDTDL